MRPESTIAELRALQRAFFAALAGAPDADADAPAPESWIAAPDAATARARLAIYSEMYAARLRDALAQDYPALCAAIGPALFAALARDYLRAHPSTHGSLRHLGRHLPDFLRAHPLVDRWPFVPDLARLELERGEMIDRADADPVSAADLARVEPARWPSLRLGLVPAHRLLRFDFPVHRLWLAIKRSLDEPTLAAAPVIDLEREPTHVLTWRRDVAVFHRVIDEREHDALACISGGAPFGEACQRLAAEPSTVVAYLRRWVADGLVVLPP